ncbi:unnamed protein product [Peronospora destructor]|uniref:Rhodanese domain-containing protein n=1 Tax=Peronospora destructor TaxID=86335 RepID=A0AAV0VGS8_9STRA|nr:unnamed protein product [Peronospora destructor]
MDIVGSSISGATILVWGVSFFVRDFSFLSKSEKYFANDDMVYTIRWRYLAGIVVISASAYPFNSARPGAVPLTTSLQVSELAASKGANVLDFREQSPRMKHLQGARKEVEF